jgi:FkbM family methyltransferase
MRDARKRDPWVAPDNPGRLARAVVYEMADLVTGRRGLTRRINDEAIRFPPRWARYFPADYQHATHRFLASNCRGGTVAIDVGAHLGIFTVVMARRIGPDGRVLAFEPAPDTRRALTDVISRNSLQGLVEIRPEAVSARSGSAALHITGVPGGVSNSLVPDPAATHHISVRTVTIDSALDEQEIVSCMKIDAEGAEVEVLLGAERTITKWRPAIALDAHPDGLAKNDRDLSDLWERAKEWGYQVYGVHGEMDRAAFLEAAGPFEAHLVASHDHCR